MQFLRTMCRREAVAAITLLVAVPVLFTGAALKVDIVLMAGWALAVLSLIMFVPTYLFSGRQAGQPVLADGAVNRKGRRARQRADRRLARG